jgi:uncharacterized glyoxalase superfamily protein PhnB
MTGLARYLLFDGTARLALEFYAETFGGSAEASSTATTARPTPSPTAMYSR